ncbi:hypothetical protein D0Z00_002242 [Geotrichum galactomycetum]|uniref:Uncharacterized protein n=1 Tax=Geotrichum galactomycetum TaxID=27317 RepID=A0ACB6V4R8_9ASCO|nr:hypothetical protein D0Z00_002242 [Geotrichum candidum]
MGRPRPKVSKSTVKGHPFAVKVMRRAMQAELDNDRTLNPHSPESSDEPGDPELAPDNGALDDTATTSTAETRKGGSGAGADDNNSQVTFQFPLDMNTAELVEIMKKKIADKTISSVDGAAAAAAAAAMAAVRGGSGGSSNGGSVEGAAAATAAALAAAARSSSNEPRGLGAASVAVAAAASFAAGMTDSSNDSQASVALQIYDKFDDLMVDFQKEITGKMLNGSFDEFLQIYKKVLDRNLDTSKFDGKTAAKRVDDRRNIKEVLDDDESYEDLDDEYDENNDDDYDDDAGECEECCSNPDCENFTVEAVAGLSVPIYSVLIRTNIEYAHHQTNSKPRRATIGGNSNSSSNNNNNNNSSSSGTGTNNDLIPANMLTSPLLIFSYVRDNLHYGKSGDKLNIFKTIRTYYDPSNRDTPAAADPPFFARLDQLIHEEEELKQFSGVNDVLKRERERSRYSTGYSFPGDRSARAYPKSGNGGSDNDSESCNPRTTFSLTPANYGDFVLTIPVLDFVKPIVRDGTTNVAVAQPPPPPPPWAEAAMQSDSVAHVLRIRGVRPARPLPPYYYSAAAAGTPTSAASAAAKPSELVAAFRHTNAQIRQILNLTTTTTVDPGVASGLPSPPTPQMD